MSKRPQVTLVPVRNLEPNKRNDRSRSKKQIKQRADSIPQLGLNSPFIIDENFRIFGGQARLEALKVLMLRPDKAE